MTISAIVSDNQELGYYRVFAESFGNSEEVEITFFRGAPIEISVLSHSDPFGDKSAGFNVKNISIYDTPGSDDLSWLTPWSKIRIIWEPSASLDFETKKLLSDWSWEGNIASWSYTQSQADFGVEIECVGALYILDNLVSLPFYPSRPVPYEVLIGRSIERARKSGLGIGPLDMEALNDPKETVVYRPSNYRFGYLRPVYLTDGQQWSGFSTRETGDRQKMLTNFIANKVTDMYSQTGKQWTLMNKKGRIPVLKVRESYDDTYIENNPSDRNILYIDAVTVSSLKLNQDYSETANVIYGTGTSFDGRRFTSPFGPYIFTPNIPDSQEIYYSEEVPQPFSYSNSAHPPKSNNTAYDKKVVRKEAYIDFTPGINPIQALEIADRKRALIEDPGFTGNITLSVDPHNGDGFTYPRYLIKAGQAIVVYFSGLKKQISFIV
jgi:hypothetical protein